MLEVRIRPPEDPNDLGTRIGLRDIEMAHVLVSHFRGMVTYPVNAHAALYDLHAT